MSIKNSAQAKRNTRFCPNFVMATNSEFFAHYRRLVARRLVENRIQEEEKQKLADNKAEKRKRICR